MAQELFSGNIFQIGNVAIECGISFYEHFSVAAQGDDIQATNQYGRCADFRVTAFSNLLIDEFYVESFML